MSAKILYYTPSAMFCRFWTMIIRILCRGYTDWTSASRHFRYRPSGRPVADESPTRVYRDTRHDITCWRRFVTDNLSLISDMFDISRRDKNWIKTVADESISSVERIHITTELVGDESETVKAVTNVSGRDKYAGLIHMRASSGSSISKYL